MMKAQTRLLEKVTSEQVKKEKADKTKDSQAARDVGVELLKKPARRGIRFVSKSVEEDASDEEIEEVQESEHPTSRPVRMIRRTAPMPQNPGFYMDIMLAGHVLRSTSRNVSAYPLFVLLSNISI